MQLRPNTQRLASELDTLATFSEAPTPAVTRVVFSAHDLAARKWLKNLFVEAGLTVREDAVGNTFARWSGSEPEMPAVGTGSHIDAIPNAGRYDGTVGVLGGLEAIRALQHAGFQPRRSIELLLFTSEEPTRFGVGCLGSRLLSGALPAQVAASLRDPNGKTLDEIRSEAGFAGQLRDVPLSREYYAAFIELHIEQGPILEQQQIPLGIVTAIAAPASIRIVLQGEGGHAGAVLMPDRHDALVAAAEVMLAIEQAAFSAGAIDAVATTGICDVFPGAVNSIPSRVTLGVDVRDIDRERRDGSLRSIESACEQIAKRRGVPIGTETLNADDPAECDPQVITALEAACRSQQLTFQRMVSRAYHDSLFLSRIAPTAMLFIPCRNSVSHRPDEYASIESIREGVRVLASAMASLAER